LETFRPGNISPVNLLNIDRAGFTPPDKSGSVLEKHHFPASGISYLEFPEILGRPEVLSQFFKGHTILCFIIAEK